MVTEVKEKQNITADVISKALLLLVAILPIYYFAVIRGVSYKAFIFGAGSWGIGCIIKILLHQLVVKRLHDKNYSNLAMSFFNGFVSGVCELGAAFLIIFLVTALKKFTFTFDSVMAFGIGIGAIEIWLLLRKSVASLFKGTVLEGSYNKFEEAFNKNESTLRMILIPPIERILVLLIHISTRGLIFIAFFSQSPVPAVIALIVFIIADGFLGFYFLIENKLLTSKGINTVYYYMTILTIFSLVAFFASAKLYQVVL